MMMATIGITAQRLSRPASLSIFRSFAAPTYAPSVEVEHSLSSSISQQPTASSSTTASSPASASESATAMDKNEPRKKQLSGLQKQVLALYRNLLRTSQQKDEQRSFLQLLEDKTSTTFSIKNKFRTKASSMSKRDLDRIEYNIRQGEKYIKMLQMSGVTSIKMS
eukprot:CAMPEP_0197236868 /NCGR_PEP_ID=MMETSP1429-20130617/3853_1 /TAXON_ID=49237 /ORGANISM="Chaetoceros  sp., Strain UNC1202" /LENGTH=164 /DNA_ID=CAMNT_0042695749 /DNA_START=30 /DNA_END=524 /DNA_ORIENTATION=+